MDTVAGCDPDNAPTTPTKTPSPEIPTPRSNSVPIIFPPEVLEQLKQNAERQSKVTLIGHLAGETPPLEDIRTYVDSYLLNSCLFPEIVVNQVCLLAQGYFTITFSTQEGADKAFAMSPLRWDDHVMFLHAWTPNFSPPPGEASLLWALFPGLPRIYYPYLEFIANSIGRVVWQSEKASNIQPGFPPKIRILVADVLLLPGSVSIPMATGEGWFEQRVSYEGVSNQVCGKCRNLTIATDGNDDASEGPPEGSNSNSNSNSNCSDYT